MGQNMKADTLSESLILLGYKIIKIMLGNKTTKEMGKIFLSNNTV